MSVAIITALVAGCTVSIGVALWLTLKSRKKYVKFLVLEKKFLTEIGYIVAEPDKFEISTKNVDPEIASIPGPQLVVPIMNARYALNAANARWGSLYDAMYGTNAIGDLPLSAVYNAARGKRVIAWTKDYLDRVVPLAQGSHAKVDRYKIINDVKAVTIKPLYKAAIIFFDLPNLTKNVPIIDVKIHAPPIDKG